MVGSAVSVRGGSRRVPADGRVYEQEETVSVYRIVCPTCEAGYDIPSFARDHAHARLNEWLRNHLCARTHRVVHISGEAEGDE